MIGKKPRELEELVELPASIKEAWYWFLLLNNTRPSGMGISPISYTEMYTFFALYDIIPDTQEIDLIKMFDGIALEQARKQKQ